MWFTGVFAPLKMAVEFVSVVHTVLAWETWNVKNQPDILFFSAFLGTTDAM